MNIASLIFSGVALLTSFFYHPASSPQMFGAALPYDTGTKGRIVIQPNVLGFQSILDASSTNANQVYYFPNLSGTVALTSQITNSPATSTNPLMATYLVSTSTTATSTFAFGLQTTRLNVTTGTSTFGNGLNLSAGCFSVNGVCLTNSGSSSGSTTPTILDRLPLTNHSGTGSKTYTIAYTVPSGSHTLFVFPLSLSLATTTGTITVNGVSATIVRFTGASDRGTPYLAYLAAPTSGNVVLTFQGNETYSGTFFTLQNAAQTNPLDAQFVTNTTGTSLSNSTTTNFGSEFVYSQLMIADPPTSISGGQGLPVTMAIGTEDTQFGFYAGLTRAGNSTAGSETIMGQWTGSLDADNALFTIKAF